MSPLRERAYAEIDSLNEAQVGYVLEVISGLKKLESQQEDERVRLTAIRSFESMRRHAQTLPDMTLDEINEEIRAAREERRNRQHAQVDPCSHDIGKDFPSHDE